LGQVVSDALMQIDSDDRPIPFTVSRASTELVQSRKQVDAARRSLVLALEIFGKLEQGVGNAAIPTLRGVLVQLEEAEAALWEVAQ
jgi:hypothetical protein